METNLTKIDVPYLQELKIKMSNRIKEIEKEIKTLAKKDFNLELLCQYKICYPV